MKSLTQLWRDLIEIAKLPSLTINLMLTDTAQNDPFYAGLVKEFYAETRSRSRRVPLIRHWRHGVAICCLPDTFDEYFMLIEAAARRNFKKAKRLGYTFERIEHNDHLKGIQQIHASTDVRQGKMPEHLLTREIPPCNDPPSQTDVHDYPYFGVMKDGELVAYAGALVSGEAFMIEQIYGHADHHPNGVVPMLLIGMAEHMLSYYPHAKYYIYEMFYGAGDSLRRFKKKFRFLPHRVTWTLGATGSDRRRVAAGCSGDTRRES